MKTKKKTSVNAVSRLIVLSILTAFLQLIPKAEAAVGDTFTVDQLKYEVTFEYPNSPIKTVSVWAPSRAISGDITIPPSVANKGVNYTVAFLQASAFERCTNITSVIIPDTINEIQEKTFERCTSLTSVIIPDSVISIGQAAFFFCSSLENIIIPDSVTEIGRYAFRGCVSLTNITISDAITSIGRETFHGCSSLTSIEIPDSVTEIGISAFASCSSLANVTIPDGISEIKEGTFSGCTNLTNIKIPDSVISIGRGAFAGCSSLTNIEIPDSVTSIGENTFFGCSRLTSIVIPDSVTEIQSATFKYCTNLTSIEIPDGVTYIGDEAFLGCTALKTAKIGNGVTSIGDEAFHRCDILRGVYFEGNAPSLGEGVFVSPSVIYYRQGTFGWTNPWGGRPATVWTEFPNIIEQPKSRFVMEGDSVTFSVSAVGREPLSYQWYKEGVLLEGVTGTKHTIESVSVEDLGNYTVVVSNELGQVTSDIAVLSYLTLPVITVPLENLTVDADTPVSFQIKALGADDYQWYKNDVPIDGANSPLYTIESAKGIDVGAYKVVVSNRLGAATSSATLVLTQPYRATGEVLVANGLVVGLIVIDGGWGYVTAPQIRIRDKTGSGATGRCIVENGIVTQIILDDFGSDYSEEATILIGSPFSNSGLEISVSKVELEMSLTLGMEYQLWSSVDCINWEKEGEPFIAEEEEMSFFFKVEGFVRYFKFQKI